MKNANSRFVRVLAIALVVLMVVPAALVGCGSNKANNAAISEALAAAEAAKKEAEEAKAAADAAAEEAQKKAEEAIKAAEEAAQKALEEALKNNTTAAPTTQAPTEDLKVVTDYASQVLTDKNLDFLKTYFMYAYGYEEDAIKGLDVKATLNEDPDNDDYAFSRIDSMIELYEAAKIAIYKANTVDYINQIVANFVAAIVAVPTYVEDVVAAYEKIDFASNYDVIDVVYANALANKAITDGAPVEELEAYGEDEINVLEAIATEYFRYTGNTDLACATPASDVEEGLYKAAYDKADAIAVDVAELVGAAPSVDVPLDVAKLEYDDEIDDAVAAVVKAYTKWNNDYFVKAKDAELVNHYDAFRKAFVGEVYITSDYEGDYVWDTLLALEARAAELLDAAAEYKATIAKDLKAVAADFAEKKTYMDRVDLVAKVKAALDAWMTKYNFKDAEGNPDANVQAIVDAKTAASAGVYYSKYLFNTQLVDYFVYLEKTASAVNAADFEDAYEDLQDATKHNTFDLAEYGSAVASVLDWYLGKANKDDIREKGFISIAPTNVKGFEALIAYDGDEVADEQPYSVEALIDAENVNIVKLFDNLFDFGKTVATAADYEVVFNSMDNTYGNLLNKKDDADDINEDIAEALEKGVKIDVLNDVIGFIGADYEAVLNPEDDDDLYLAVDATSEVGKWVDEYITKGDVNFLNMIDWAGIEALYANYKASTAEIEKVAIKIALEYIAWKGDYVDDEFAYKGVVFDLEPMKIDIFSYDIIKEVLETYEALQGIDAAYTKIFVPTAEEDVFFETDLKTVTKYCYEMLTSFYSIVDTLENDLYVELYNEHPFLSDSVLKFGSSGEPDMNNAWYKEATVKEIYDRIIAKYTKLDEAAKKNVEEALGWGRVYHGKSVPVTAADGSAMTYDQAIVNVDPSKYYTKDSSGNVTGIDKTAYTNAIKESIKNMYPKFIDAYIRNTVATDKIADIIDSVAEYTLATGIWTLEDEIVIDGDTYDFSVNTNKNGNEWVFILTDADGVVVGDIEVEYDNDPCYVRLTPALVDGKFTITPTLVDGNDLELEDANSVSLVYEFLDDISAKDFADEKALVYDVRDYADAIVANFDKITSIPFLGDKAKNLDTLTVANLEFFFDAEVENNFWVKFATLKDLMYKKGSTAFNWTFGTYISNITKITDEKLLEKLNAASMVAYERAGAMTADANSIEDVEKVFDTFRNDVKNLLRDKGVAFTEGELKGYEQITIDD